MTEAKLEEEAVYNFDLDEETAVKMAELGLKFLLHCHICGVEFDEVFEYILSQKSDEEE